RPSPTFGRRISTNSTNAARRFASIQAALERTFTDIPPIFEGESNEGPTMSEPNLVDVYSAGNALIAHTVKAALEEAGIPAVVDREELQNTFGDLVGDTSIRILVDEGQAAQAR